MVENDDTWRRFLPFELIWAGGRFGRAAAQVNYWWYHARELYQARQAREREAKMLPKPEAAAPEASGLMAAAQSAAELDNSIDPATEAGHRVMNAVPTQEPSAPPPILDGASFDAAVSMLMGQTPQKDAPVSTDPNTVASQPPTPRSPAEPVALSDEDNLHDRENNARSGEAGAASQVDLVEPLTTERADQQAERLLEATEQTDGRKAHGGSPPADHKST